METLGLLFGSEHSEEPLSVTKLIDIYARVINRSFYGGVNYEEN